MADKYDKFISLIQLDDICLLQMRCRRNEKFEYKDHSLTIHLEYDVKKIEQDGIEITIPIYFRVAPFYSGKNNPNDFKSVPSKDVLFQIECTIELKYIMTLDEEELLSKDLESFRDELEIFAGKNVPINAWPYARELISNISTKMGFPPLIIPVFKKLPKY